MKLLQKPIVKKTALSFARAVVPSLIGLSALAHVANVAEGKAVVTAVGIAAGASALRWLQANYTTWESHPGTKK